MPETFLSTTRLRVTGHATGASASAKPLGALGDYNPYLINTELQFIQSETILGKVIEHLGLDQKWAKRYRQSFKTSETLPLLKAHLDVRPVRNTSLIEIRIFDEKAEEAATIANEIAHVYQSYWTSASNPLQVEIVDWAQPGLRPARPNKPQDLAIGALAGALLGTAGGAGRIRYESRKRRLRAGEVVS